MALTLPAKLAGAISDREAVADALYRVANALDHADEALLLSAVSEDISTEMAGKATKGIPELKSVLFDKVSKLDTTHFLSNIRVAIESDTTAKLTCSAMATHVRPGKGFEPDLKKFTSGALYLCDMVKDGDLWKIKGWKAKIVWVEGDRSVMSGH